jgi:hypothetical protein
MEGKGGCRRFVIAARDTRSTGCSQRDWEKQMNSTKKQARVAGFLYLLASIPGAFCLIYIPSRFIVSGDAAATANKIAASESLFRFGILSELAGFIGFIFVARALYGLFAGVSKAHASLMVTLIVVSIPISLLNVLNETVALTLIRGANFLSVFDKPQRDALALLFLHLHFDGITVAQIFWGLWLIPFGTLVLKSGFLPKILGVLLIVACFGYLANSISDLGLLPKVVSRVVGQLTICELPIIFWLLIVGAKDQPLPAAA